MPRPRWFVNLLRKMFPKRYAIARLVKIPGLKQITDYLLFKDDAIFYLLKDDVVSKAKVTKTIAVDKTVSQQEDVVLPSEIIHYFIDKANYHWIMNFCICRQGDDCQNYPQDFGCLFLGEATVKIDPELGRQVTREEAHEHIRKSKEMGLVNLIGRNKIDKQWLGVGPSSKLMTICNCCECCCLFKMLPQLPKSIGRKITKMPGVEVKVLENCTNCGECLGEICFVSAITSDGEKVAIDQELCRGCGRCVTICPEQAIELSINDEEFITGPKETLDELVDVT